MMACERHNLWPMHATNMKYTLADQLMPRVHATLCHQPERGPCNSGLPVIILRNAAKLTTPARSGPTLALEATADTALHVGNAVIDTVFQCGSGGAPVDTVTECVDARVDTRARICNHKQIHTHCRLAYGSCADSGNLVP